MSETGEPERSAATGTAEASGTGTISASTTTATTVDASGRKWLTPEIPYDVFPGLPSDDAIAAAATSISDGNAIASTAPAAISQSTPDQPASPQTMPPDAAGETAQQPMPPKSPAATAAAGSASWDAVLPVETLQNEIAAVRNDLNEKLLTVGSYNAAFEQVGLNGWLMSALSTIVHEHPAPVSWKDKALLARDASVAVAMAATGRGRQNFGDAEVANEQLVAILSNNTPPGLATPDPQTSREETADRAALMQRMQTASDRLKALAGDAESLDQNATAASHEAELMAAIARFTSHTDYTSAENADYQAAAAEIVAAGGAMSEAAASRNATAFAAAFDRVGTACNQCHVKYRFEN